MTEAEWLEAQNPLPMIRAVRERVSERKWRLFCCALCRWTWDRITDPRARQAVEVAERFADGLATAEELQAARTALRQLRGEYDKARLEGTVASTPRWLGTVRNAVIRPVQPQVALSTVWPDRREGEDSQAHQARRRERDRAFLYDILGPLPFRPVPFSAAWRTDTVLAIAKQAYDSREFSATPILADALQDAGCDSDELMNHCRGTGPHVRGCWVVDLVLGKE